MNALIGLVLMILTVLLYYTILLWVIVGKENRLRKQIDNHKNRKHDKD
jgi:predicted permease